ncbi:glycosyltransferase family 2 protein [Thiothrix nivea]|uniref:Glycosyl transferase family 2 n=1 Tax=Thiothrix nivea (strain ATCC 35100 / DSM 5205 / JP2) TaxID=870187 RepID=A0A656HJ47_THINJ|nr:glycosyltransferase [Thiothrix nivea]EIJ36074.1 glycosyl transferase family 2 [Thiothrix nivea DSM 5205]
MKRQHANKKVSVILPVYNHERWVKQAIDSVLAQSFPVHELIIIDDASQDASWEVIQSACQSTQDIRIHCLRHASNQGAPATLNQGLQLAQGDYLAILNSDDVWDKDRLQWLVTLAEAQALDFISTDVALLDADSSPAEQQEPHWVGWFEGLKQDYAVHSDLWATLLRGNCLITTSNFFFHRRVYECVGEFADLRYVHDYDYALRVLLAGFQMRLLVGEKLLGYRLHGANTIRERPLAAIEENMRLLLSWLPALHEVLDEQRLQGLEIQLKDLYRYTGEEWLTVVHQRLLAREQELFPLISDRDGWIAERDAWVAERDAIIQQQAEHLAERDAWIAERDGMIADMQQHLIEQQQWVCERDDWIAERDEMIRQQAEHLAERDRWVRDRDGWIAERDAWVAERDTIIRQLRGQQQALLDSRAFRLGQALLNPLRRCRQVVVGGGSCLKN